MKPLYISLLVGITLMIIEVFVKRDFNEKVSPLDIIESYTFKCNSQNYKRARLYLLYVVNNIQNEEAERASTILENMDCHCK